MTARGTRQMSRKLAEPIIPTDLPQCEATRTGNYASDRPGTDKRCVRSARFDLNGKKLCQSHAQQMALAILMNTDRDTSPTCDERKS